MIESKYINGIIAIAVALALIATLLLIGFSNSKTVSSGVSQQYETKLFGGDVITIDIIADSSDWDAMIENATSEEYIRVDVVINGTKFQSVGIRPKGNSSLSQVASDDTTDRFSFRIKFDEYIKGQSYFGLDTFVVNNMLGDNSYMKEYLAYDILKDIGVDVPLYDFTNITVNGEAWGFYLAIEAYDDSFLNRVYGDTAGNLYNVKSMDMGNMGNRDTNQMPIGGDIPEGGQIPNMPNDTPIQNNRQMQNNNPNNFMAGGMGGRGSSGGDLKYTDESISSYSSIFDNAIGITTETDQQRIITALKNLSTSTDLETYFDIDQILRYMAAHTVVVNLDSYSSSMAQNYYIYEKDGTMTILPWDYNFSFGGFQSGSASALVNFPIDTPVSGVTLADRPLFDKLLENEAYKIKYHEYLDEIMTGYFSEGKWAEKVMQLDALIANYVENDPTAFCTIEAYKKAVSTLITLGELRAESIMGQLEGTVPSTTTDQDENPNALILTDQLILSDLGGGMFGGDRGNRGGQNQGNNAIEVGRPGGFGEIADMPDIATIQKAMEIIQSTDNENLTEEQMIQLTELGLTQEQVLSMQSMGNMFGGSAQNDRQTPNKIAGIQSDGTQVTLKKEQYSTIIICVIVLLLTTLFVSKFKRNY